MKTYTTVSTKKTPQSEKILGSKQVANNAGGFVFQVDKWTRLERFIVLGSEGGTYYVQEKPLTKDNAESVIECIREDGKRVVDIVVAISDGGRAPKNDPALFVLAMCAGLGDSTTRKYALDNLSKVARIGTHLFHFLTYVQQFRGWGRGLRVAVGNWYNSQKPTDLAYGLIKYQGRDGWTNRDVLRQAHPVPPDPEYAGVYKWVAGKGWSDGLWSRLSPEVLPSEAAKLLWAFEATKRSTSSADVADLIRYYNLPREAIPTNFLNDVGVWKALNVKQPITATLRNLAKMTAVGLLKPMDKETDRVVERITNPDILKKGRVHPIALLLALKTYQQGHGDKGSLTWEPVREIVDALDKAFYLSFGLVEPTNKRIMLALDVSGSMDGNKIAGTSIDARMGSAAMALITANVEPHYMVTVFSSGGTNYSPAGASRQGHNGISTVDISPRQRLDDVMQKLNDLPFGGTDCALPMLYAAARDLKIDAFVVYTDNETWAGNIHPVQALQDYRRKSGVDAKLVVVGMVATDFSIADPNDAGSMDVVGFDTATPNVISDFIRG